MEYADDLVLLAKTEEGTKEVLRSSRRYLERKNLKLNVEKSNILLIKKGCRSKTYNLELTSRNSKRIVKKYLGMWYTSNDNREAHARSTTKREIRAAKQTWSIGERKFEGDFRTGMLEDDCVEDSVVKEVILYESWERLKLIEKVQIKYIKLALGLDRYFNLYSIVLEETKWKVWTETERRVIKYKVKKNS